jgi:hypothetical protein
MDLSFKGPIKVDIEFVLLQKCLTPWRRKHDIDDDYLSCGMNFFAGESLLQHCDKKGNEYRTTTALYLRTLFKKEMGLTQYAVHRGKNDQSRMAVDVNEHISGCYYQPVDSQESLLQCVCNHQSLTGKSRKYMKRPYHFSSLTVRSNVNEGLFQRCTKD